MTFDKLVWEFVKACWNHHVKMILVGGGAVNFHGYQRHSADVDFWLEVSDENLNRLKRALEEIEIELDSFPEAVTNQEQNISIKISPLFSIELITRFNPGKTFEEAWENGIWAEVDKEGETIKYKVLHLNDLIDSKLRSNRPKDLLDVQELQRKRKEL